jgi:pentafunctional AROM polypeptide
MAVMIDMACISRRTALVRKAEAHGWTTVDGVSLLLAQGFEQFQQWTGRRAPAAAVTKAVTAAAAAAAVATDDRLST